MTTADPTAAPQPATPAQALRWAADRLTGVPATLTADTLLRRWADELDAAPATPGEAIDLDAVAEDLYEASEHIDHPDAAYHPWALKALRTAEKLAAEVRRLRGEWQVLTDRWGHYKRQYLGALEVAERLRGELADAEAARANLQRNAEILADEVVLGNAVVTPALDAAPAADPGVVPAGTSEALIEALEVLVHKRGMDPTDRDPATCAWLPLMDVVDIIRRWAADPGVYRLPDPADLARERQQIAHEGTGYVPAWEALTDRERETSTIEAGHWVTAIGRAYAARRGPLSTTPPAGGDDGG